MIAAYKLDACLISCYSLILFDNKQGIYHVRRSVAQVCSKNTNASLLTCLPFASFEAACGRSEGDDGQEKSGRRDSNPRQPLWESGTLPLSYSRMPLYYHKCMRLSSWEIRKFLGWRKFALETKGSSPMQRKASSLVAFLIIRFRAPTPDALALLSYLWQPS